MKCKRCGLEMTGKPIDKAMTVWRCAYGHKYVEWKDRASVGGTYPHNLEHK